MTLDQRAFPAVSSTLRSYMHLSPSDPIDLVVLSAILSNFTPDRLNPLWFVLIASPESGKSMLLDVLLTDWPESWSIQSTLTPAYFFTGRPGKSGVLGRIDRAKVRILHMNDMAGLLPLNQRDREILYTQLIGMYEGNFRRETGFAEKAHIHKRPARTRLGWVGAATEAFYEHFAARSFSLGARFTPYYWQPARGHWTDTSHLPAQRLLRGQRLTEFKRVRTAMQAFMDEAVYEMGHGFKFVTCPPSQAARIDAATSLSMRVCGGDFAPPGGRTSDRAVQFARTAAFIQGLDEVEQSHGDLAVRMVLSQMHPRHQHLIDWASRPEQLKGGAWWTIVGFLRHIGAPTNRYMRHIDTLVDIGVFDRNQARGKWEGSLRLSADALQLVALFDPGAEHRASVVVSKPVLVERVHDASDDPAEIAMGELEKLEAL